MDPGPSNSQDVRFMDGVVDTNCDDMLHFPMGIGEEQSQWPPHTNAITYELRSPEGKVIHKAPALADTTRARRRDAPLEIGIGDQEEYFSDEGLNIPELDKVARVAMDITKEVEKENKILHDRQRPNVIHDLEGSDGGE